MGRGPSGERRAYWRSVISRQKGSGRSIAAFCRDEGISPASFYSWRRRLASAEAAPRFVPLPIAAPQLCFEIRLPGGIEITVPAIFEPSALEQLLEAVQAAEPGDA